HGRIVAGLNHLDAVPLRVQPQLLQREHAADVDGAADRLHAERPTAEVRGLDDVRTDHQLGEGGVEVAAGDDNVAAAGAGGERRGPARQAELDVLRDEAAST